MLFSQFSVALQSYVGGTRKCWRMGMESIFGSIRAATLTYTCPRQVILLFAVFFLLTAPPPPVRMHQMGNNNSSRYGVVTQLQFDDGDIPKMVGSLNRTYLLEKSRVVSRSSRERNFHVFYQMVGSDDEEFKKSLQLSGLAWHHLSYSKPSLPLCGNEDPLISIGSVGVAL